MEILYDPNIAYLLLAGAIFFTIMAMMSPGTGILEISALATWLLAGWGILNLTINWWALIILLVGVVLFFLAVYKSGQLVYLASSIVALVVGSLFMFPSDEWWVPAVNPFLALAVSLFMGIFFWVVARKVLEARMTRPAQDLEALIGEAGIAKSDIYQEGSVQVSGELWTARSEQRILVGEDIRVISRDGFILEVEPLNKNSE